MFLTANVDYVPVDEELTIFPGQEPQTCTNITIITDSVLESNETFHVSVITDLPSVKIGVSEALITIIDNDGRSQ